jgi:PAT family beta-lactamase induction signal transducer AmpG
MTAPRASTSESLRAAFKSWRFGAVTLLSLSSGAPLGLVLIGVPSFLAMSGIDIKTIGLVTLAQAPYAFKFVWSPLLDRFRPPFLGRKRGWVLVWQLVLAASVGLLAAHATSPQAGAVAALTMLIAFASASQDIAIDAYAVESLRPAEQGLAAGSRTALYRVGMWLAGNISISVAPYLGWGVTLGLQALVYLALLPVTVLAPEPEVVPPAPRTLREAVWEPVVGFFRRSTALELAGFLVVYKLADNLAIALIRPFLIQKGYSPIDVGIASGTISLAGIIAGTFLGGVLSVTLGLGRALWLFGALQALSGLGYAVVASVEPSRLVMYLAVGVEATTIGLATGALDVMLLRLTDKRFSATQYALLSSTVAVGRTIVGPIAGFLVDAIGWRQFFIFTVFCAIPGLLVLQRIAPFGAREIDTEPAPTTGPAPMPQTRARLIARGLGWTLGGTAFAALVSAGLRVLKASHAGAPTHFATTLLALSSPTSVEDWVGLASLAAFGLIVGFAAAAHGAARRGLAPRAGSRAAAPTSAP